MAVESKNVLRNRQLKLFQNFMCNTDNERGRLSNTIDFWDRIPRYSISQQQMRSLRSQEGSLQLLRLEFQYRKQTFQVVIQAARVRFQRQRRKVDGVTAGGEMVEQDFYPSANEELVEEALRKFAGESGNGFFDKDNFQSGVFFTLHMLRKELGKMGHARSYAEISLSLSILAQSNIRITGGTGIGNYREESSNFFPQLLIVRERELKVDPNARCFVQFHPLVTRCIDELTYRQFNYEQMMRLKSQLARWLFKLLVMQFTFASLDRTWTINYQRIKRDSAMLYGYDAKNERMAIRAVSDAFDELKSSGVIEPIAKKEYIGSRKKVMDVEYVVTASEQFIKEMIAANARRKDRGGKTVEGIPKLSTMCQDKF